MNEQGLRDETPHQDSEPHLSEPHFDDIAIAIAQPVEPLLERKRPFWRSLGSLRMRASTTVLVIILAGAVGFGTVAFGLAGLRQQLNEESPQAEVSQPEPSVPAEATEPSNNETEKDSASRPAARRSRPRVSTSQTKPTARLVGEIR